MGDALIERDASHGYLETVLTARYPERQISFRNLGWSGDTVYGHARAGFGTPADGFKQLEGHILSLKPTVILAGYGMTDSFDGEAGLPRFVGGAGPPPRRLRQDRGSRRPDLAHPPRAFGPGSGVLRDRGPA